MQKDLPSAESRVTIITSPLLSSIWPKSNNTVAICRVRPASIREALPLSEKLGDKDTMAFADLGLGRIEQAQGNHASAFQFLSNSLSTYHALGDKVSIAGCLDSMAGVKASLGDGLQAARLFGAAEALRETLGAPNSQVYQRDLDGHVGIAQADVGELFFQVAWDEGRDLTMDLAIEEALAALITVGY